MSRKGESQKDVGRSQQKTFSWTSNGKKSKSCTNNGKADNIILIDIDSDDNINNVISFNVAESLKQKLPGLTVLGNGKKCPIPIIVYIHDEDEIFDKNQPATPVDDDEYQFLHEILPLLKLSKCRRAYCTKVPSRSHCGFGSDLDGELFDNKLKEKANKLKKDGSEEKVGKHSKDQVHLYPDFHNETPFATSDMKSTQEACFSGNSCKSFSGDENSSRSTSADNENLVFEEPLFRNSKSKDETRVSDGFAGNGVKAGAEYVKVSRKENSKSKFAGVEKSRGIPVLHNKTPANSDMRPIQETKGKKTACWVKVPRDKESPGPDFSHNEATLGKESLVSEEPLFQKSESIGETRVSDDLERNNVEASSGKESLWGMPDLKEREKQCQEKVQQVPKEPSSVNKPSCNEAETETGGEEVELKKENRTDKISKDGVHLDPGKVNCKGNRKSQFANSDLKSTRGTKGKQTARWVKVSRDKETPEPDLSHNKATVGTNCGKSNARYVRKQHEVNSQFGNDSPRCCRDTSADQENLVSEEPSSRNSESIDESRVRDDLSGNDVTGGDMNTVHDGSNNVRERYKETEEYKRAEEEEWASRQHALRLQAEEAQRMRQELKRMKAEVGSDTDTVQDCLINMRERYKETDEYKRAEEEERASRQHALRLQAEEARKMRQVLKRMKAEKLRKLDMEKRQKQRIEEIRETQKKNEENMNMKEKLRAEVRMELEQLEAVSLDMGSLLRGLGVPVSGGPEPQPQELRGAYKKALLSFHPDRVPASDIRKLVEAEEKFKLISRLKEKFFSTS